MNTFKRLVKEGKIGRLCKRGAWVVAGLGMLEVVTLLYGSWQVYKELPQNQGGGYDAVNFFIFPNIASAFLGAATTLFFFLVLYSAGAVINSFYGRAEEDITITSLDEGDAVETDEETARTSS